MKKEHFITIKGQQIPVTEEVYFAYKRPAWRERKRRQVREEKERSLDVLMEFDMDLEDPNAMLLDEVVEDRMILETLMDALTRMSTEDRALIRALFYDNKTEQAVANELGVTKQTVNKRKQLMISNLRKIFFRKK